MPEFYVTYDREGQHYLAMVFAPQLPDNLQFANYEDLSAAMDSLGNDWELRSAIQDPREYDSENAVAWLKRLAEAKALERDAKPEVDLRSWRFPGADMVGGDPFGFGG
jgi:uncharacterized protein YijF (DUF1287 family)